MDDLKRLSAPELRARANVLRERAKVMLLTLSSVRQPDRADVQREIQRAHATAYNLECAAQRQEAVGV